MRGSAIALLLGCLAAPACGGGGGPSDDPPDGVDPGGIDVPVRVDLDAPAPSRLSAYHLLTWDAAAGFAFNERVVPYDVNTALFSDYALKQRAIYIPDGAAASYDPEQPLAFPVGSVIIKTFSYPADVRAPDQQLRLIETRLMVRHPDGWHPLPYIWDADQRDAVLSPAGEVRAISFIDGDGAPATANYLIPERNQCQSCHARQDGPSAPIDLVLIGVKARHLNRSYDYGGAIGARNQLDYLAEHGMLTGAPAAADAPVATDFRPIEAAGVAALPPAEIETAARDYLDINCAHCHNPKGVNGMTSQLFLNHDNTDLFRLGVCKLPGSAGPGYGGLKYDIVPGDPDASILHFRTDTEKVGAMMPLLGRSLTHGRGVELLRAWIAAMPPNNCGVTP